MTKTEELALQAADLGFISQLAIRQQIDSYLRQTFYDSHIKQQVAECCADLVAEIDKLKLEIEVLKNVRSPLTYG